MGSDSRSPSGRATSTNAIPTRLHQAEGRLTTLEKKVRSLSDGDTSFNDSELVGKHIRMEVAFYADRTKIVEGTVKGVSKYTIKIQEAGMQHARVYRKGFIIWHEEVDDIG